MAHTLHMGDKHSVLVWKGTLAVCTLTELFVVINNVTGNGKVAHKHVSRISVSVTAQAFVGVGKRPPPGGRGWEWGSWGGGWEGLLLVGGGCSSEGVGERMGN